MTESTPKRQRKTAAAPSEITLNPQELLDLMSNDTKRQELLEHLRQNEVPLMLEDQQVGRLISLQKAEGLLWLEKSVRESANVGEARLTNFFRSLRSQAIDAVYLIAVEGQFVLVRKA